MHPGRALIWQAKVEPLSILCGLFNGGRSARRDMFQVTGGWFPMERDPGWFGRLKNDRLPNLKILGEGDGPAPQTEACYESEYGEKFSHAFFLTKLVRDYQEGPDSMWREISGADQQRGERGHSLDAGIEYAEDEVKIAPLTPCLFCKE